VVRDVLEHGELLVSDSTVAEFEQVLRRSKFDRYVSRTLREEFLAALPEFATRVAIVERIQACRDPKDDKFLETAVNGLADFLVTGDRTMLAITADRTMLAITADRTMLAMRSFRSVVIVSPSGYLRIAPQI
jgi:uncharacterized protein